MGGVIQSILVLYIISIYQITWGWVEGGGGANREGTDTELDGR